MLNEHSTHLLKYPVLVLSIILGIGMLKLFGMQISSIGFAEFRFELEESQDAAKVEIQKLASDLKDLRSQMTLLEKSQPIDENKILETEQASFEADQQAPIISSIMTKPLAQNKKPLLYQKTGYIFAGNIKQNKELLLSPTVSNLDGYSIKKVDDLMNKTDYLLLGNMVLRASEPLNTVSYYKGIPSLGIVAKSTKVQIIETPIKIDRGWATQVWIKIKVLE
ncbi:MAG: hypothetical protein HRU05_20520 [Oceanospirillaceae bacterium]|nr:hypothetical protein [Oceanospirillaceae bacterium]